MISRFILSFKTTTAAALLLLVSGCDVEIGAPLVTKDRPVTIALLVPAESTDAGVATLASSLANAAQLAVRENPGANIDLKIYATQGDPQVATEAARQAIDDGAKIIIGPLFSEASSAVSVAVSNSSVNVLSFSNDASVAGGRIFVLGNTFRNTADRLVGYASARGLNRIAAIAPLNKAGQSAATEVDRATIKYGAQFTGRSSYEFNLNSIVEAAPTIAGEVTASGANAMVLTADSAGALPLLAQLLPENGLDPATVKFLGLARWDIPPENLAQRGLQGGWFAVPDFDATERFNRSYMITFGSDPHPLAGLAYDGVTAVAQLLQSGEANVLSGEALLQSPGFNGATGIFRFQSDGTVQRGLAVAEVANGTYTIIDPAPRIFGGASF